MRCDLTAALLAPSRQPNQTNPVAEEQVEGFLCVPETPARRDTRRPRACALPGREEGACKRGGPRCAAPVRSRQRPAGQGTRAVAGGHAAADAANTVARSGHLAKRIVCVRAPSIGTRGVGTSLADKQL